MIELACIRCYAYNTWEHVWRYDRDFEDPEQATEYMNEINDTAKGGEMYCWRVEVYR